MTGHVPHEPDQATTIPSGGGFDRRTVLRTAGLAGVGAVALTACGAAEEAADTATDAASGAASAAGDAIKKTDIPVGGGKIFSGPKVVVTQPADGDYKAFSAVCTHKACVVSSVSDGTINCACHGSKFDIATGEVKNGPAAKALPAKSLSVDGDGLKVT